MRLFCLLTLALSLAITGIQAEYTKGTTKIYFAPGGEVSAVLFDHVKIDCGNIEGKWQEVVIYVPSSKEYFNAGRPGDKRMQPGDTLVDSAGRKIGYVASNHIDMMPLGSTDLNIYQLRISGWVESSSVDPASIPEVELEQLLAENKNNLTLQSFTSFMTIHGFERHAGPRSRDLLEEANPQYQLYDLYFDSYIGGPTVFRMQFVFMGSRLVAILHGRKLTCPDFQDAPLARHNHLLWVGSPGSTDRMKLIQSYNRIYGGPIAG